MNIVSHSVFFVFLIFCCSQYFFCYAQGEGPNLQEQKKPLSLTTTINLTVMAKGNGRLIKRAEVRVGEAVFYTDLSAKVSLEIPQGQGSILTTRHGFETLFVSFEELRSS